MKYNNYAYNNTSEDFNDMHSFFRDVYGLTRKIETWDFVRLEFWRVAAEVYYSSIPNFFCNNAQLWRDESGKLKGLLISESGGDYFSILVHPDSLSLAEEIAYFARDIWGMNKKNIVTDGFIHSKEVSAILKAGLKKDCQIGNVRKYHLENMELKPVLEKGFTIKCITEALNYLDKLETISRAFNPNKIFDGNTRYWRSELPSYCEDLDLSVISPNGKHISLCYGFIDKENSMAVIETVATRSDYQKRGFGKAVITECFRRLREKGVKSAYITGYSEAANALYQSLKPVEVYPLIRYKLENSCQIDLL